MDSRPAILNILKRRPQAFGIPLGSNLPKLRPEDLYALSKKTCALFAMHKNLPALSKVVIAKLDQKGNFLYFFLKILT